MIRIAALTFLSCFALSLSACGKAPATVNTEEIEQPGDEQTVQMLAPTSSTLVPTLVLGYSVKSRGIAIDLFGTDEHYVLPVQQLCTTNAMTDAFQWLMEHEQEIKSHLAAEMPQYTQRAREIKDTVAAALECE